LFDPCHVLLQDREQVPMTHRAGQAPVLVHHR
jgi:hypothetical protein